MKGQATDGEKIFSVNISDKGCIQNLKLHIKEINQLKKIGKRLGQSVKRGHMNGQVAYRKMLNIIIIREMQI